MNLTKMFTWRGPIWVDADQLTESHRKCLTIYTAKGNRKCDTARTEREREQAAYGVHRNNVFPTLQAAIANREAIFADMAQRN